MTRVEKYRRYREEIANMKFETFSSKKDISKQIGRMCDDNENSKLNYEQVLNLFQTFDDDSTETKCRHHIKLRKSQVIYWSIASLVILGLIVGIIIVACNL